MMDPRGRKVSTTTGKERQAGFVEVAAIGGRLLRRAHLRCLVGRGENTDAGRMTSATGARSLDRDSDPPVRVTARDQNDIW